MLTTPVFFLRGETDNLLRTVLQDGQEILHGLAADEADHHWPVVVRHSGLSSKWIMVEDYYISCHRRAIDEPFSLAVQGVGDGEIEPHWGCAGQHHLLPLASRRQGLLYVSREKLEFRDLTIECFEVDEGHVVISCLPGVENPSAHRRVRHLPREVYVSISCLPGAESPLLLACRTTSGRARLNFLPPRSGKPTTVAMLCFRSTSEARLNFLPPRSGTVFVPLRVVVSRSSLPRAVGQVSQETTPAGRIAQS